MLILFSSLHLESRTWQKETDDLFDFESNNLISKNFTIKLSTPHSYLTTTNSSVCICHTQTEILEIQNQFGPWAKILGCVSPSQVNPCCFVLRGSRQTKDLSNLFSYKVMSRLWKVSPKDVETELKEGNIIKLGRIRLKIDKICLEKQNETNKSINELKNTNHINKEEINTIHHNNSVNIMSPKASFNIPTNQDNSNCNYGNHCNTNVFTGINNSIQYTPIEEDNKTNSDCHNNAPNSNESRASCRICYIQESTEANPLITPCKCSGSMGFIHIECLRRCISSHVNIKETTYSKFFLCGDIHCEICKMEYPKYFKIHNKIYSLIDMKIDYEHYILCSYSMYDDETSKTEKKGMLVINLDQLVNYKETGITELSIGRTQNSKIKLKDISVSRLHMTITLRDKKIYFKDKGSKFGSMVYINKDIIFTSSSTNTLQFASGKHFFKTNIINSRSFIERLLNFDFVCCECKTIIDKDYVLENDDKEDNSKRKVVDLSSGIVDDSYDDLCLSLEVEINENHIKKGYN
jgi:hypothetical protein